LEETGGISDPIASRRPRNTDAGENLKDRGMQMPMSVSGLRTWMETRSLVEVSQIVAVGRSELKPGLRRRERSRG
jgi:hypothetical protein